jgi:hypothetical protein
MVYPQGDISIIQYCSNYLAFFLAIIPLIDYHCCSSFNLKYRKKFTKKFKELQYGEMGTTIDPPRRLAEKDTALSL